MNISLTDDWVLWLLCAISLALCAFGVPSKRINWMCLGFMFAALTFVV